MRTRNQQFPEVRVFTMLNRFFHKPRPVGKRRLTLEGLEDRRLLSGLPLLPLPPTPAPLTAQVQPTELIQVAGLNSLSEAQGSVAAPLTLNGTQLNAPALSSLTGTTSVLQDLSS